MKIFIWDLRPPCRRGMAQSSPSTQWTKILFKQNLRQSVSMDNLLFVEEGFVDKPTQYLMRMLKNKKKFKKLCRSGPRILWHYYSDSDPGPSWAPVGSSSGLMGKNLTGGNKLKLKKLYAYVTQNYWENVCFFIFWWGVSDLLKL